MDKWCPLARKMLVVPDVVEVRWLQGDFAKANCAGQWCGERDGCRRYEVRIEGPEDVSVKRRCGGWISADVEREIFGGECPHFRKVVG